MGQREVVLEGASSVGRAGAGTVRMGRWVVLEMGGPPGSFLSAGFSGCSFSFWLLVFVAVALVGGRNVGPPEIVGGGSSRLSLERLDSWRAKSELYHHSKNFRANMEVGSRIFRLPKTRGMMVSDTVRGLKIEFV